MTGWISAALRSSVTERAKGRCEYCRLSQEGQEATLEQFRWRGVAVEGLTPTGRATVEAMAMNRPLILAIREEEAFLGRHPVD